MMKIKKRSKASLLCQIILTFSIIFGGLLMDAVYSYPEIKSITLIGIILSFVIISISSIMLDNVLTDLKD